MFADKVSGEIDLNSETEKLTRKGSKHAQPELRKQQIMEAAIVCFSSKGYAETTIDMIAKQATLSKGSVYRFFSSKEELLLSLIDYFDKDFVEKMNQAFEGKSNLEKIEIYSQLTLHEYIDNRELTSLWFQLLNLNFAKEKLTGLFAEDLNVITSIIEDGIEQGEFKRSALEVVPRAVISQINGHLLIAHFLDEDNQQVLDKFDEAWQLIKPSLLR